MVERHSTRGSSGSKTPRGDMSTGAIKARLIRATSTLQNLPSQRPDTTVRSCARGYRRVTLDLVAKTLTHIFLP